MPLPTWTLGSLLRQLRLEFGEEDDDKTNEILTNKINLAIRQIARARNNWPWLRKDYFIEVPAATAITVGVTQGSTSVTGVTTVAARDIFVPSAVTDTTVNGYTVSAGGTNFTLQSVYRGTTEAALSAQVYKGVFELPSDFNRLEYAGFLDSLTGVQMNYVSPVEFDKIKNEIIVISLRDVIYTVRADPLGLTKKFYLCVFPYINELTTIKLVYWGQPTTLANNSDVPVISENDQDCLFYFAAWFYAQARGFESFQFYRDQAMTELRQMMKITEKVDEDNTVPTTSSDPSSFIPGPPNYPEFE